MSSLQKGLDVFLVRHPAHKQRHRAAPARPWAGTDRGISLVTEQLVSTPWVQLRRLRKPALQHAQHTAWSAPSRRKNGRCESAGTTHNPRHSGTLQGGFQDFRKFGVKGRGERQSRFAGNSAAPPSPAGLRWPGGWHRVAKGIKLFGQRPCRATRPGQCPHSPGRAGCQTGRGESPPPGGPAACISRTSSTSVVTTPLTWGCQASVIKASFMPGTLAAVTVDVSACTGSCPAFLRGCPIHQLQRPSCARPARCGFPPNRRRCNTACR
jgi:hypothetical protein